MRPVGLALALGVVVIAVAVVAAAAAQKPKFEVASIKPSAPANNGIRLVVPRGDRYKGNAIYIDYLGVCVNSLPRKTPLPTNRRITVMEALRMDRSPPKAEKFVQTVQMRSSAVMRWLFQRNALMLPPT
jgi:hypothetical protein